MEQFSHLRAAGYSTLQSRETLSLGPGFVHSFEISELKNPIYTDLIKPSLEALTFERLAGWQASLFPTGYAGVRKIVVAELRAKELSKQTLSPKHLKGELAKFLYWWTEPPAELDPVLRSALSFYWLIMLSPFEAGNFELASASSELALQESEKSITRFYDVSVQLLENRAEIQQCIDLVSTGTGDITDWMVLYLKCYVAATQSAYTIADKSHRSEKFWKNFSAYDLNARQRKILNLLLEEDRAITNRECVEICNTSRESAKRDLSELVRFGILKVGEKKGRSVNYSLIY